MFIDFIWSDFKSMKKICTWVAVLFVCFMFVSCGGNAASDYSKSANWLSAPSSADKNTDVFYLYPSAYSKLSDSDPNICRIDNPDMIRKAKLAFGKQATTFETTGNIFAPYYRQADAVYSLTLPAEEHDKVMGGIPAEDAIAAFDYYIKNYNGGRPYILAGHSQGSNVLLYLLSDYMKENPEVYSRMIAAYVIGYSVTDEYLAQNPHLKFARGRDDTGVIISYNTQAPAIEGTNPVVLPSAHVINPITWTTNETLANAGQNAGSIKINPDGSVATNPDGTYKLIKNFADAKIDQSSGVLICSTADVDTLAPGKNGVGRGIFHNYDYPFYYFDIGLNAQERTQTFFSKQ